jgi:hypothetical protein
MLTTRRTAEETNGKTEALAGTPCSRENPDCVGAGGIPNPAFSPNDGG